MSLSKYCEGYQMRKEIWNIVICIYHKSGWRKKNPINEMLERLQKELKKECDKDKEIQVAYVYETPALGVKKFEIFTKDTPVYYKEPCKDETPHSLVNVWLMGLALLEQRTARGRLEGETQIKNWLYLLTDELFDRVQVNSIIWESNGEIVLHPRFSKVIFKPVLIKTEDAGGDLLETYIGENVYVFRTWKEERENGCS